MQPNSTAVDVRAWLDAQRFSSFQWLVVFLCFCVVAVDGFDTACIGFIAPALRHEWAVGPSTLGTLFGAGLAGLMVGAFSFGPMADKVGRKKTLIVCVAFFGISSIVAAYAPTIGALIALRFVTGIGLGGAMPNAIALTSEYCPEKRKSFVTTVMFCGFTLGSGCGGLVAAELVPAYGWRSVLLFGGILPLTLVPVLIALMPESVRYLVANKTPRVRVAALLRRISPIELGPYTEFTLNEIKSSGSPVRQLFAKGFRNGTLLLWCVFFMSLLIVYLMTSWLPTLIHNAGMTLTDASRVAALYQIGGTAGALTLGRLMDRFRPPVVLGISYAVAAPFIISLGQVHGLWLAASVAGVGFFINGSQIGANAFSAQFYPTESRVTGISWALGVGRLGSIFGAVMGGVLLAANMPLSTLFILFSIPAVLASLAAFGCGFGPSQHVAVPATP